jgi:hypothetical protein
LFDTIVFPQERLAALALSFLALNGVVCRATDQYLDFTTAVLSG